MEVGDVFEVGATSEELTGKKGDVFQARDVDFGQGGTVGTKGVTNTFQLFHLFRKCQFLQLGAVLQKVASNFFDVEKTFQIHFDEAAVIHEGVPDLGDIFKGGSGEVDELHVLEAVETTIIDRSDEPQRASVEGFAAIFDQVGVGEEAEGEIFDVHVEEHGTCGVGLDSVKPFRSDLLVLENLLGRGAREHENFEAAGRVLDVEGHDFVRGLPVGDFCKTLFCFIHSFEAVV